MSFRCVSPIKAFQKALWRGQAGGMSPFMYGLVIGVTVFSAMAMQQAKRELAAYQQRQAEMNQAKAQDVAKAMDFAILTEDKGSYDTSYDLDRARQYATTTAKTRGDEDFLVTSRQSGNTDAFGNQSNKVAIAATDDTLVRQEVNQSSDADELARIKTAGNAVVVYDTSAARDRQIRTSITRMDSLAEQVYAFYAAHLKFPTGSEFAELQKSFDLTDSWGAPFDYSVSSDQQSGEMSFTTPWGYKQSIRLNLNSTP